MGRTTIAALGAGLLLALAGCAGTADNATPASRDTTTLSTVDTLTVSCRQADRAAVGQSSAKLQAMAGHAHGAELHRRLAAGYRDLAARLHQLAGHAPEKLRPALADWSTASTAMAESVARPDPDVEHDRTAQEEFRTAQQATGKACGHPIPTAR